MASETQALLADGKLAGSWTLDRAKSSVGLRTKSVWGLVKVKGVFSQVAGEAVISAAGEATGTITVAAASIDTGMKKRDDHLRSADFFDAAKSPDITFSATSVALSGESATVSGTLTVRDQTRPVTVNGTVSAHDAGENTPPPGPPAPNPGRSPSTARSPGTTQARSHSTPTCRSTAATTACRRRVRSR